MREEEFRREHSISSIVKRGTNVGKKELDEKKVAQAEATATKKRQSDRYTQTSLEDQIAEAAELNTANDLAWRSKDAIVLAKQLDKVLRKGYWTNVPVDCFFQELKKVCPQFYNLSARQMTKSFVMRAPTQTCTAKDNLGVFIKLERDIADEKAAKTLSSRRRTAQWKRIKASELDI